MTQPNVQPAETADQPDPFAEIAGALYRLAADIASLTGSGLPKPNLFQFSVQTGTRGDDELTRTAVDAWATALFDRRGAVQSYPGGVYHYGIDWTTRGPITAAVYMSVSAEWALKNDVAAAEAELAEREADLEKARARVAELRGRNGDTGLSYSREPESTVAAPVPAGVDGHPDGRAAVALDEAHVEALVDDNDRAKWAVIRGLRAGEAGRVHNPNLARFLAGKEDARREAPLHLRFVLGDSACGLLPTTVFDGTSDVALVTCEACREVLAEAAEMAPPPVSAT